MGLAQHELIRFKCVERLREHLVRYSSELATQFPPTHRPLRQRHQDQDRPPTGDVVKQDAAWTVGLEHIGRELSARCIHSATSRSATDHGIGSGAGHRVLEPIAAGVRWAVTANTSSHFRRPVPGANPPRHECGYLSGNGGTRDERTTTLSPIRPLERHRRSRTAAGTSRRWKSCALVVESARVQDRLPSGQRRRDGACSSGR